MRGLENCVRVDKDYEHYGDQTEFFKVLQVKIAANYKKALKMFLAFLLSPK